MSMNHAHQTTKNENQMPVNQNTGAAPDPRYAAYVNGLCHRYANQISISVEEVEGYAQNINPLMARLVSCVYNLAKHLFYSEIQQIFQSLETMDRKEFCISMYYKYQNPGKDNEMTALNTLFHALLLRDFYTDDFEKISTGGNFGPVILELTRLCLHDQPYDVLCNFIHFPEEEVPYINRLDWQRLIDHCQGSIVPDHFDKKVFSQMIHDNLQEIISTMYNLSDPKEKKEASNDKDKPMENKPPLSWVQSHMAPKEESRGQPRKKVVFEEPPATQGVGKKVEPKKKK